MTNSTVKRCRVFVVDNNVDLAETLAVVIGFEPDLECVGVSSDGTDALTRVADSGTDVMVLDLSLPGRSALSIIDELKHKGEQVSVVIYTGHAAPEFADEARARGAAGYVIKGGEFAELAAEIRRVYAERHPTGR